MLHTVEAQVVDSIMKHLANDEDRFCVHFRLMANSSCITLLIHLRAPVVLKELQTLDNIGHGVFGRDLKQCDGALLLL